MSVLIDGYNLLHASGILGSGVGPGSLERSRSALLNFLAESLAERQLSRTTIVFDAREAPPGLPRTTMYRGMTVCFAPRGLDADAVIEDLIAAESSPRRLTVVSSDHRLHRAARRRRAKAIDSDVWYGEVIRLRIERARKKKPAGKPAGPISDVEVRFWLREFGIVHEQVEPKSADATSSVEEGVVDNARPAESPESKLKDAPPGNPFPPGYGEDISEEDV
jgi:predicted RNA-binding protein with PIN domain